MRLFFMILMAATLCTQSSQAQDPFSQSTAFPGTEVRGKSIGARQFSAHKRGLGRLATHVTASHSAFQTRILVENHSLQNRTVTFMGLAQDGRLVDFHAEITAPAQSVRTYELSEIFANAEDISHFYINEGAYHPEDRLVSISLIYANRDGSGSAIVAPETTRRGRTWRVFSGDWNRIFDGVAVVNTGPQATDVFVDQMDHEGNVLWTEQIAFQLQPWAKALYVIGDPARRPFEAQEGVYYRVRASQDLAVTALRGDDAQLSQGEAVVLEATTPEISGFNLPAEIETGELLNGYYQTNGAITVMDMVTVEGTASYRTVCGDGDFSLEFQNPGVFRFDLTVYGADGSRLFDSRTVTVREP